MKIKIVEVKWADSKSYGNAWQPCDEVAECAVCRSVGYLVQETSDKIVLAQSVADEEDVMNKFVIPRGCIKKIRRLKS